MCCFDVLLLPVFCVLTLFLLSSDIPRVVTIWRENLKMVSERASQSLAEPDEYPDLFPDLSHAIAIQQWLVSNDRLIPAFGYSDVKSNIFRHLIDGSSSSVLISHPKS
jgi:coatomer subunit beta'